MTPAFAKLIFLLLTLDGGSGGHLGASAADTVAERLRAASACWLYRSRVWVAGPNRVLVAAVFDDDDVPRSKDGRRPSPLPPAVLLPECFLAQDEAFEPLRQSTVLIIVRDQGRNVCITNEITGVRLLAETMSSQLKTSKEIPCEKVTDWLTGLGVHSKVALALAQHFREAQRPEH